MKIPGLKLLQQQDYPSKYQDLIGVLFTILNQFMQNISQALNGHLTYSDNFDMLDVSIEITAPVTDLKIKNKKGGVFKGYHLAQITPKTNPLEQFTSAPFVSWYSTNDNQINIKYITGLTSGNKYNLRILFFR